MSTVEIKATNICVGGGHVEISARLNAGAVQKFSYTISDVRQDVTGQEADAMVLALMRLHGIGLSDAQLKSDLQAGITVTV